MYVCCADARSITRVIKPLWLNLGGIPAAGIWCCICVCAGYAQPWMTPVCVWPFHSVFHGWIPGCRNLVLHSCMRWICSAMNDTCVCWAFIQCLTLNASVRTKNGTNFQNFRSSCHSSKSAILGIERKLKIRRIPIKSDFRSSKPISLGTASSKVLPEV